jgi:hypothetical protein
LNPLAKKEYNFWRVQVEESKREERRRERESGKHTKPSSAHNSSSCRLDSIRIALGAGTDPVRRGEGVAGRRKWEV